MKEATKTRFVSDVDLSSENVKVRRPFKVSSENRRKFIRLEIMSPMSVDRIKDIFGRCWWDENDRTVSGTILNISAGGVLVELQERLNEGDIVAMTFSLQGIEQIKHVPGIVKRTDDEEEYQLAGIEFVKYEQLADKLTRQELDNLGGQFQSFHQTVREVLDKYVYNEK